MLEYISIYTRSNSLVDTRNSHYMMKYEVHVDVVSLNLTSDKFKQISVPSISSFRPKSNLQDLMTLQMLPVSEQKWTQYMGKHGDSKYEL